MIHKNTLVQRVCQQANEMACPKPQLPKVLKTNPNLKNTVREQAAIQGQQLYDELAFGLLNHRTNPNQQNRKNSYGNYNH